MGLFTVMGLASLQFPRNAPLTTVAKSKIARTV